MPAYYNEIDPFAAAWLRNLISEGLIAPGDVDERSIEDVRPDDLEGYEQCHFFAGIGGWSLALRLAGWPDDRPVWTGSCPCPPFSTAGKRVACPCCQSRVLVWCPRRTGFAICADCHHAWLADARHLWPELWRLVSVRRPARIYGEQVASPEGVVWLSGVRGSLEICRYAVGASDLPAAGVGAPNIRQRFFWMADAAGERERANESGRNSRKRQFVEGARSRRNCSDDGHAGWLADAEHAIGRPLGIAGEDGCDGPDGGREEAHGQPRTCGEVRRMGDPDREPGERRAGSLPRTEAPGEGGVWRSIPIVCDDGKIRRVPCDAKGRVEPALFPLADAGAVRNRVGLLRGSGNAINPFVAADFIRAGEVS